MTLQEERPFPLGRPRSIEREPALELKGIRKSFGPVQVLHGVDLQLFAGEVHALLGENGAGKSTLSKILCGILSFDEGEMRLNGQQRRFMDYDDAVKAGIGIVFQEFSLIPYLNAVENVFLGREKHNRFGLLDRTAMRTRTRELLGRLGIQIDLDMPIHKLSVAQQQFVEIAKALALDARILVLDEPTATLTPVEVEHLFVVMRQLRAEGVAIVFISHHLDEIFEICDRITVLRDGHYVDTTSVAETDIDRLVLMMVGRRIEAGFPDKPDPDDTAQVVLRAREMRLHKNMPPSEFELRRGEILGFAGLVGSGRTEMALALLGEFDAASRRVELHGTQRSLANAADALASGIGLLPENRKDEGLIVPFSVRHNISLNNYGKYRKLGFFIDGKRESADVGAAMAMVRVKAPGPETRLEELSGGNQQKVVIARWLNHDVDILIFDEPTRGIDVGAKVEIYHLMRDLTRRGVSIIMISSELPEVVGMSDRVCVFRAGRIVKTLAGEDVTAQEVMKHATAGGSDAIH
ncbi:MAG: sugar ABC transporter ATP-binding protein [Rhizobiaceae bacterium]|nr:sugar ABC transporter ATP-binding protein [Rhizobiaceae bacterium]